MPFRESSSSNLFPDFFKDSWGWDEQCKPPEVQLSHNKEAAYFYVDPDIESTGAVGVKGTKSMCGGEHYWEVVFLEPPCASSVMIGLGTGDASLRAEREGHDNLIGHDSKSWGLSYKGYVWHDGVSQKYCEPFFDQGTVIGVHLDLARGCLTFYKDGVCLGPAFTGLRASRQRPLYPMISSTARETELGLGTRIFRLAQPSSLQNECFDKIRSSLSNLDNVESLPLPRLIKNHLRDI